MLIQIQQPVEAPQPFVNTHHIDVAYRTDDFGNTFRSVRKITAPREFGRLEILDRRIHSLYSDWNTH